MAVTDGVVVWIGQDAAGDALFGGQSTIVDLDGAFVAPAFVDAHVHSTSAGLLLEGLDLTDCRTLADCLRLLREHATANPRTIIWGHGWDESRWPEGRPPTRAEIDAVAAGNPVYLSRIDVHSALVSSALLDQAPEARTAPGFHPDGPLTAQAHHAVRAVARNSIDAAQRRRAQHGFLRHAAAQGIAAVHECAGPDISDPQDLTDLLVLAGTEDLPEVTAYWGELASAGVARRLRVAGLAGDLFVDGALGSRTALLTEPYTDAPDTSGAAYLDSTQIADHLVECTRHGMQAGFHVIGDRATAEVIEGFRRAEAVVGLQALTVRGHRLEHLEMVDAEQAAALSRWGVIASVQPMFDALWGGPDGMYVDRLGATRGIGLNPFATLASAGVSLAFGSDAPVTPIGPWAAVRAAVHHRTPGAGISPRAAFTAHTRGGWRASGASDELTGSLVPGASATYAIWTAGELVAPAADNRIARWSTDPRSRVPRLPNLQPDVDLPVCRATVLRGRAIHDPEGLLPVG
ncbi:putative TIM-barrel fold metal-dependent hydrolase [Actinoalloteichus hymeniacidonis]|uniref:TIM-barrel fold metal-dependent hydrolase n=2 Tax=Actinoalloteichus hymeniacidonis TaxID=340345 RepID=A0AAC9HQ15_9PSEU|nr:putative TIM-barrel fold metal-dependent hydrolase [Actinoalloteichus hymeniacidonis]